MPDRSVWVLYLHKVELYYIANNLENLDHVTERNFKWVFLSVAATCWWHFISPGWSIGRFVIPKRKPGFPWQTWVEYHYRIYSSAMFFSSFSTMSVATLAIVVTRVYVIRSKSVICLNFYYWKWICRLRDSFVTLRSASEALPSVSYLFDASSGSQLIDERSPPARPSTEQSRGRSPWSSWPSRFSFVTERGLRWNTSPASKRCDFVHVQ